MVNNYEFRALATYKECLFHLICYSEGLSDLLIDLLMPKLDDNRFDKIDNFTGGNHEYVNTDRSVETVNLKGHLFDVPFVYSTVTDNRNVICIDTNISKSNQSTKEMSITIYVMCHKGTLLIDDVTRRKYKSFGYAGKNRLDIAVAILGDILNGSRDLGNIGKLDPISYNPVKSYAPNTDFFGKVLDYSCSDFMKKYSS